ncbi:MAG: 50S ribosomal protein L37ae [Candidatus ainarchaeum sp.]|nr:50S ribosomal protein L37ae [Candidatus ainarchaeum sp.]
MVSRYGRRIRNLAEKADLQRRASYECPKCNKVKVRRKCYAIWKCRSCGSVFAGGAYSFTTPFGETAKRLLKESS